MPATLIRLAVLMKKRVQPLCLCPAYTIGIEGMADAEADEILRELYAHQGQEALFIDSVGSRTCWSSGTIARWFIWQLAATRVMIECCNA